MVKTVSARFVSRRLVRIGWVLALLLGLRLALALVEGYQAGAATTQRVALPPLQAERTEDQPF